MKTQASKGIDRFHNIMNHEECVQFENICNTVNNWYQAWLFRAYNRNLHKHQCMVWNWKLTTDDQTDKVFRHSDLDDINWRDDLHPIFRTVYERVLALEPRAHRVVRIGLNGMTKGDFSMIHVDQELENPTRSFVLYCNSEWQDEWGGETYFVKKEGWKNLAMTGYDDISPDDITFTTKAEPGNCIGFNALYPHAISPTSIDRIRLTYNIIFEIKY